MSARSQPSFLSRSCTPWQSIFSNPPRDTDSRPRPLPYPWSIATAPRSRHRLPSCPPPPSISSSRWRAWLNCHHVILTKSCCGNHAAARWRLVVRLAISACIACIASFFLVSSLSRARTRTLTCFACMLSTATTAFTCAPASNGGRMRNALAASFRACEHAFVREDSHVGGEAR